MSAIIETVVDRVKTYIEDNLPEYLTDMESSEEDHLKLPMFGDIFIGDHDISSIDSYPSLLFRYGQVGITQETTTEDLFTFNLSFWIVHSDTSYENMQRTLFRYAHCFKAIFDIDRSLGGIATESNITGISFSPVFSGSQSTQMCFIDSVILVQVNRRI